MGATPSIHSIVWFPSSNKTIYAKENQHFDLRPGAIIRDLNLRRPIYQATAAYGHFGRDDIDAPWEAVNKAVILRDAAQALQAVDLD